MFRYLLQKSKTLTVGILTVLMLAVGITPASAQDTTVAELQIIDFPATIRTFTDFRFTVQAVNSIGTPVETYVGTVEFTSDSDENAVLPTEYVFTSDDKGLHEFTESYYFTEEGTQTLTVTDTLNPTLEATIEVNVTSDASVAVTPLTISAPIEGVTTNSTITVRGETTPGIEVQVYNGIDQLGTTDANSEGDFEFQTSVLPDGSYSIIVKAGDAESDALTVVINTEAPDLEFIQVTPEILQPGSNSQILVRLKDTARSVQAVINGTQTSLTKDSINPRQFSGIIAAPNSEGSYPITLNIEDELGNTNNNVPTTKSLDVSLSAPAGDGTIVLGSGENPTFFIPSQVTGVQATSTDKQVSLTWAAANANSGIKNYLIYYGTDVNALTQKVETFNSNTTWYIPNLVNGSTYYFTVFAVDNDGNRSDLGSQLIAATPGTGGQTGMIGSGDGQITVNTQPDTGPGTVMFVSLASISLAGAYSRRKYKSVK